MEISLSISKGKAINKEQAGKLTEFETTELNLDAEFDLDLVFTNHNYSCNIWKDGQCRKDNYIGMTGIILDVDAGLTLDEAKQVFKPYKHILHTSTNHQTLKKDKPACDRFRVILPFKPQDEHYYPTLQEAEKVYKQIKQQFPFVDPMPLAPAGKFYPYLGEPDKFILEIHRDADWFSVPQLPAVETKRPVGRPRKENRITDTAYIRYDMEITLTDKTTKLTLEDLRTRLKAEPKHQLPCFCPFCDDINSQNPSATIQITCEGFVQLFCSHCKSVGGQAVYWEDPVEPGMFMLEDKLVRVQKNKDNAYIVKISEDYIRKTDRDYVKTYLSRMRNIPTADLKVESHTSAEYECVDYELDTTAGILRTFIPTSLKDYIQDNAFIDKWLDEMFGTYSSFVKDWMAIYCYDNYKPLPVLILSGPRGNGKSTFGEVLAEVFPQFFDSWKGESTNFTPYFKMKLLLIEENEINKKEQYTKLKEVTGSAYLSINEKYVPQYKVRNNIKIIVMTNELRPVFLVKSERPVDANNNNFFIYRVPALSTINPRMKEEILKRFGHYIRTELKNRFERWQTEYPQNKSRYCIPCPISRWENDLYESALTGLEAEVELLSEALINGIRIEEWEEGVKVANIYGGKRCMSSDLLGQFS